MINRYQKPKTKRKPTRITRLVKNAYPAVPDDLSVGMAIDRLLEGLCWQEAVKLARPKPLYEALTQALEFDADKQSVRGQTRVRAFQISLTALKSSPRK